MMVSKRSIEEKTKSTISAYGIIDQLEAMSLDQQEANKLVSLGKRTANNNTVKSVCLVGSFIALSARLVKQQNKIEALEVEKASLIKTNKDTKQTMWDWKQQLYSKADSALVPLSKLRAIYGESPTPPKIDVEVENQEPAKVIFTV